MKVLECNINVYSLMKEDNPPRRALKLHWYVQLGWLWKQVATLTMQINLSQNQIIKTYNFSTNPYTITILNLNHVLF